MANKAPAVPGAIGENPEPNPVVMIIWISETFFILYLKYVQIDKIIKLSSPYKGGKFCYLASLKEYGLSFIFWKSINPSNLEPFLQSFRAKSVSPFSIVGTNRVQVRCQNRALGSCRRMITKFGYHTYLHVMPSR